MDGAASAKPEMVETSGEDWLLHVDSAVEMITGASTNGDAEDAEGSSHRQGRAATLSAWRVLGQLA